MRSQLSVQASTLQQVQSSVGAYQQQLAAASAQAAQLQALVAERDKRIAALEQTAAAGANKVEVGSLISSIGEQVNASAVQVSEQVGGRFQVSDVRLSLKVLLDEQGKAVSFPKASESAPLLSTIDVGLRSGPPPRAGNALVRVPSLLGYTALLAERKLRALGLRLESSYQTVTQREGEPSRVGQVVEQRPTAGARVAPGSTVELLLGKG
jgi:hypothetical protein